ncbi:unnamed protein product [Discosporangium mesarthrocarpum]
MEDKSWVKVMSLMYQNPPVEAQEVFRSDKLVKNMSTSAFNFDKSPHASIVKEVHTGFVNLFKDTDVITFTFIDIKVLADNGA